MICKNWWFHPYPVFLILEPVISTVRLISHHGALCSHHVFSSRSTTNVFEVFGVGQDTAPFIYSILRSLKLETFVFS